MTKTTNWQERIEKLISKHRKILAKATTFDELVFETEVLIRKSISDLLEAQREEMIKELYYWIMYTPNDDKEKEKYYQKIIKQL